MRVKLAVMDGGRPDFSELVHSLTHSVKVLLKQRLCVGY